MGGNSFLSFLRRTDSFARGLANGITAGGADWFAGTMDSAFNKRMVTASIDAERAETRRRQAEGVEAELGEVAGAIVDVGAIARAGAWLIKSTALIKSGSALSNVGHWASGTIAQPIAISALVDTHQTAAPGLLRRVDSLMRGLANGITFGGADWFAGKTDAVIFGGIAEARIAAQRRQTRQRRTEGDEIEIGEYAGAMLGVGKLLGGAGWLMKITGLVKSGSRFSKAAKWIANYVVSPVATLAVVGSINGSDANAAEPAICRRPAGPKGIKSSVTAPCQDKHPKRNCVRGALRAETANADTEEVVPIAERQQSRHSIAAQGLIMNEP
jgi:hypothetical protein